jgi:hypothetical protein
MTAKTKPANIEAIREKIAALKTEIEATRRAGLPVEQVEATLREALGLAESNYREMIGELARSLASGQPVSLSDLMLHRERSESVDSLLLGYCIRAVGIEIVIRDAQEVAAGFPQAALRMPDAERQARLADLQRELYEAEIEEERRVEEQGLARRPDASVACVLGLPLEIAAEAGLLYAGQR